MLMADWNDVAFFLILASAERFRDFAISRGSFLVNTLASRSRALLALVTFPDHLFVDIPGKKTAGYKSIIYSELQKRIE